MVDALKIIGSSASDTLTAKVVRGLGTNSLKLEIKKFPDGERNTSLILEQIKKEGFR